MQSRRAHWAEQVRQWRQSGLTAREFAQRIGINAGTLSHWAWRLGRTRSAQPRARRKRDAGGGPQLVELVAGAIADQRFELDLGDGRRLRIPAQFNAASLEGLLVLLAKPAR
jgi:hypothetical protein